MKEAEMEDIAGMVAEVISDVKDASRLAEIRERAKALALRFPVYGQAEKVRP